MDNFFYSDKCIATRHSIINGIVIATSSVIVLGLLSFPSRQIPTHLDTWIYLVVGSASLGGIAVDVLAYMFGRHIINRIYLQVLLVLVPFIGVLICGILGYVIDAINGVLLGVVFGIFGGTFALIILGYYSPNPTQSIAPKTDNTNHYKEVHKYLQKMSMEQLIIMSYDYFPEIYRKLDHKNNKDNLINILLEDVDSERIYHVLVSGKRI